MLKKRDLLEKMQITGRKDKIRERDAGKRKEGRRKQKRETLKRKERRERKGERGMMEREE